MKRVCYFLLFVGIMFISLFEVDASNRINGINMNIYIDNNGNANIEEVWDTYLDSGTEGYRSFSDLGNSSINSFSVFDDSGKFYNYQSSWDTSLSFDAKAYKNGINYTYDGLELCWGISDYGNRVYTLKYNITNFVNQYTDKQGIYFSLLDIDQNVEKVNIKISSYMPLTVDVVKIWGLGYTGEIVFQDGSIVITDDNFNSYDRIGFLARFENNYFTISNDIDKSFDNIYDEAFERKNDSSYEDDETLGLFSFLILVIFYNIVPFIIFGLIFHFILRNRGTTYKNEYEGGRILGNINQVDYYRDIPCNKNIFNMYYLMDIYFEVKNKKFFSSDTKRNILQKRLVVALIMKWILEDRIEFQNNSLFIKNKDFVNDKADDNYIHLEKELFTYLLRAAGANGCLEKNEFKKWCNRNYNELILWFDRIEINAESYYKNIKLIRINTLETNNFFKKETKRTTVFTRELKLEALKLFGLQKFLLDFGRMYEKQTIEVSLWNYYLICAELFGIADKVRKELKNFYPELNVPLELDLDSIDDFVKVGYTSMNKARDRELSSYSSSDYDYSGSSSSSGGGGSSSSSGGSSSGGSSGGGFR